MSPVGLMMHVSSAGATNLSIESEMSLSTQPPAKAPSTETNDRMRHDLRRTGPAVTQAKLIRTSSKMVRVSPDIFGQQHFHCARTVERHRHRTPGHVDEHEAE